MNDKSISLSIIMFVLSLLLFAVSSFAWFALSDAAKVDPFVVGVSKYDANIEIEIRKNSTLEADYQLFTSKSEIQAFLNNALPADQFDFRIKIQNLSTNLVSTNIYFNNILSANTSLDMRDVFLLVDGQIVVDGNTIQPTKKNLDETIIADQVLSLNRLSNYIDDNNTFTIYEELQLEVNDTIFITFSLAFDETTSDAIYQNGILSIQGLYIEFNN